MIFMANACTAFAINIDDSRAEKKKTRRTNKREGELYTL